jgi:hypothetical protein
MPYFNFAELKAEARRVVQETLGVPATYLDNTMSEPVEIVARLRAKTDNVGDLGDAGYAEIIQGVDRIVLIPEDYPTVTFRTGGVVTLTDFGLSYNLDLMEPKNGPLTNHWRVSKA